MKILHICTDRNIGGAGHWILNLLNAADRARYEFTVLLPEGAELAPLVRRAGITVVEAPIREKSLDIKGIFTLRRAIAKRNPDIVHTHGSFSGRIAARLCGKRVVTTRHWVRIPNDAKRGKQGALAGKLNAGLADMWIATAQAAADDLVQSGIPAEKIAVILNGAVPMEKRPPAWVAQERARLGISGFVIGMLARLEEVKGHTYMLEAASRLKSQGRDVTLLIAGAGSLEGQLKEQARTFGVEERVRFLGFLENPSDFLNLLDIQVNASYTETSCLALLEGMSLGIPAVASDGGGNGEVITDGENGLLFPVGDVDALTACIERLTDDPALCGTLGENAARIFREKFTAAAFAERVEQVYDNVTKKE
ncbi:MAG: glycosyltransferase [Oscillospiraceae bacterium]|nr:glycosyltransferase [Oscillospiraceae bacterium]